MSAYMKPFHGDSEEQLFHGYCDEHPDDWVGACGTQWEIEERCRDHNAKRHPGSNSSPIPILDWQDRNIVPQLTIDELDTRIRKALDYSRVVVVKDSNADMLVRELLDGIMHPQPPLPEEKWVQITWKNETDPDNTSWGYAQFDGHVWRVVMAMDDIRYLSGGDLMRHLNGRPYQVLVPKPS